MSCGNSACRSLFFTTGPVAGGTYPNVKGASVERPNPSIQFSIHSRERFLLRNSWNTSKPVPPRMGPFRMVNNAGDILSRVNYSCGGPNMLNGTTHPKLHLSNTRDGVSTNNCDNSGLEPSTCNVKYVYDSSDFTRFKHLEAINNGYGGLGTPKGNYSSGGANNGAQVAFRNRLII
jgi:hypothetical protein